MKLMRGNEQFADEACDPATPMLFVESGKLSLIYFNDPASPGPFGAAQRIVDRAIKHGLVSALSEHVIVGVRSFGIQHAVYFVPTAKLLRSVGWRPHRI
jgi:hypothetical protein